ncbi:SseB family protein [Dactylosporangium cerinum]
MTLVRQAWVPGRFHRYAGRSACWVAPLGLPWPYRLSFASAAVPSPTEGVAVSEWEPATEAEGAMRDALRANDQEQYFRILARTDIMLPIAPEGVQNGDSGWGTWTTEGRTHVLAFTSPEALRECLAGHPGTHRRVPFRDLSSIWPNVDWWLAVNPGLPIEGYLPSWFVTQITRGDVRLPGRTLGARARIEQAAGSRARATAQVPVRGVPNQPAPTPIERHRMKAAESAPPAPPVSAPPAPPAPPPGGRPGASTVQRSPSGPPAKRDVPPPDVAPPGAFLPTRADRPINYERTTGAAGYERPADFRRPRPPVTPATPPVAAAPPPAVPGRSGLFDESDRSSLDVPGERELFGDLKPDVPGRSPGWSPGADTRPVPPSKAGASSLPQRPTSPAPGSSGLPQRPGAGEPGLPQRPGAGEPGLPQRPTSPAPGSGGLPQRPTSPAGGSPGLPARPSAAGGLPTRGAGADGEQDDHEGDPRRYWPRREPARSLGEIFTEHADPVIPAAWQPPPTLPASAAPPLPTRQPGERPDAAFRPGEGGALPSRPGPSDAGGFPSRPGAGDAGGLPPRPGAGGGLPSRPSGGDQGALPGRPSSFSSRPSDQGALPGRPSSLPARPRPADPLPSRAEAGDAGVLASRPGLVDPGVFGPGAFGPGENGAQQPGAREGGAPQSGPGGFLASGWDRSDEPAAFRDDTSRPGASEPGPRPGDQGGFLAAPGDPASRGDAASRGDVPARGAAAYGDLAALDEGRGDLPARGDALARGAAAYGALAALGEERGDVPARGAGGYGDLAARGDGPAWGDGAARGEAGHGDLAARGAAVYGDLAALGEPGVRGDAAGWGEAAARGEAVAWGVAARGDVAAWGDAGRGDAARGDLAARGEAAAQGEAVAWGDAGRGDAGRGDAARGDLAARGEAAAQGEAVAWGDAARGDLARSEVLGDARSEAPSWRTQAEPPLPFDRPVFDRPGFSRLDIEAPEVDEPPTGSVEAPVNEPRSLFGPVKGRAKAAGFGRVPDLDEHPFFADTEPSEFDAPGRAFGQPEPAGEEPSHEPAPWGPSALEHSGRDQVAREIAAQQVARQQTAREQAADEAREQAAREHAAQAQAAREQAARDEARRLAAQEADREAAREIAAQEAARELAAHEAARELAAQEARELAAQEARELAAKEAARELAAQEARELAAQELARELAEQQARELAEQEARELAAQEAAAERAAADRAEAERDRAALDRAAEQRAALSWLAQEQDAESESGQGAYEPWRPSAGAAGLDLAAELRAIEERAAQAKAAEELAARELAEQLRAIEERVARSSATGKAQSWVEREDTESTQAIGGPATGRDAPVSFFSGAEGAGGTPAANETTAAPSQEVRSFFESVYEPEVVDAEVVAAPTTPITPTTPATAPATVPVKSAAAQARDFRPANTVEQDLFDAVQANSTDRFLSTLLLAKILVPGWSGEGPIDPASWRTEHMNGLPHLVVFTSAERLADRLADTQASWIKFTRLIRNWPPGDQLAFAVNPDSPIGAVLPGTEVVQLATWAAELGLGVDEPEAAPVAAAKPAQQPRPAFEPQVSSGPLLMQKPISPEQLSYYLERGYDRVSGFVHRAGEVAHLQTPEELYQVLGLGYAGSSFKPDAEEAYVLRWKAYRGDLYRIPYGGPNQAAMRAMEGWVIERPPFRGNGFAPSDTSDVIAEFKVDSARLPHHAELWRLRRDGRQELIARLDADGPAWRKGKEL